MGKGGRAIIIGIGSAYTGTVPELYTHLLGKKSKKEPDYHKEMNAKTFEEWFDRVIQYFKENFADKKVALVMDNASYHSRLTEDSNTPKIAWKKEKIIQYMMKEKIVPPQMLPGYMDPQERCKRLLDSLPSFRGGAFHIGGLPFNYVAPTFDPETEALPSSEEYARFTKAILLDAIPKKEKKYVVDEKVKREKDMDIKLLRLPPYHCEFNPIELVWARAKTAVAKKNLQYKLKFAMNVMKEEALKCDAKYWEKLHKHIIKV